MFKDIASLKNRMPVHAEGHICLDFKDPITGKIVDQITGKNHVFLDALLSGPNKDWVAMVSNLYFCLMDDGSATDPNFPFLKGATVGYGRPSLGSRGNYRGAYNVANQVLAQMSTDKVRWKFQYDFTAAQANGVAIRSVGLTNQFLTGENCASAFPLIRGFRAAQQAVSGNPISDGRYRYPCTTLGIITKYDDWLYTSSTIDVSAITGTGSEYKTVGYCPLDGTYYVYAYSRTTANRKMYKFSDNTFSSLLATYPCSNLGTGFGAQSGTYPMYIYGDNAYYFYSTLYKADFVHNTAATTVSYPTTYDVAATNESTTYAGIYYGGTLAFNSKYILLGVPNSQSVLYASFVFDLSTDTFVVQRFDYDNSGANPEGLIRTLYPLAEYRLPCTMYSGNFNFLGAITHHVLAEPKTKTSVYGMTATYELEVFW